MYERPTPELIRQLVQMQRQYPDVLTFFIAWRDRELGSLPYAVQNSAAYQGRCQVLTELVKLIETAPTHTD